MIDQDYADNLALLTNIPSHAKSRLDGLVQVSGSIGLYENANKTKQKRAISTLDGKPLKLEDLFTYLSSNISSIEMDI